MRSTWRRANQKSLENAFGKTGAEQNFFDLQRALRNVGRVFQQADIARHQAGATKRKTCQKGKFQGITARTMPSGW